MSVNNHSFIVARISICLRAAVLQKIIRSMTEILEWSRPAAGALKREAEHPDLIPTQIDSTLRVGFA